MRRIFMGLLVLGVALSGGIMLGCDKEIKEAARPASLQSPSHT